MTDPHGWAVTPWECVCGRSHAPWWRSTPPPTCPHGWPVPPERVSEPVWFQNLVQLLVVATQGDDRA
ncbi:hypothetical protein [Streptomyces rubradiris]|uniref:Uncharacterized protein n=1 Tax=Streptomyces rubradiris TaxID=285531 RepID=A0ABQ3R3H2_STRRR|nr:hypothetical protein [Streptomyces rubradiris]GHH30115.1 hypothetical protein GCM10018792_76140 [Streptomyces rubradiris]GHI50395.1 hypothetical protein Srubr_02410 [Streptomyces rubradiris]